MFDVEAFVHVLIINVSAFSTTKGMEFAKQFLACHETLLAIDASTTIKTPTAKRTKNILKLGESAKYRRIMTGSPVTKNPLDLFTQCDFLSPWLLNFTSYYEFRNRYAEMNTLHMHVRQIQHVNGFKHQEELYEQMKKEAIAILKGQQSTTVNTLTQLMRLQQITCGHFTADDGATQPIANNRITELMSVLEETEGKAIIWAHYQYDITEIIKAVTKEYGPGSIVDYYGLTPQEERQPNIKRFQDDPKCRFIVGTPSTGGYGITLTAANTVIYYSNGYDLEKRLQSEDRAHRIGQKKSVTYVDLMADDTVDEKIVQALRKKINIASEVLGE